VFDDDPASAGCTKMASLCLRGITVFLFFIGLQRLGLSMIAHNREYGCTRDHSYSGSLPL
jgi:hypothetical protein